MNRTTRSLTRWLVAGVLSFLLHGAALAQTRSYVSGVGNDADPCSRTAPCRTLAGAYNKTSAGGEINALDACGCGGLTIGKSITINGAGVNLGSLVAGAGVNAITINAGAGDIVTLRNMSIHGVGTATNGIRILAAGSVHLEHLQVRNFNGANGYGIWVHPTAAGHVQVFMDNVTVTDNGSGTTGGGVYMQQMNPATATLQITNSKIADNQGFAGLRVDSGGFVSVHGSSITGNGQHGVAAVSSANPADVVVSDSLIAANGVNPSTNGAGVHASGTMASIRISGNTITDNEHGVRGQAGGIVVSYGNNVVYGNTTDGAATSSVVGF